MICGASAWRPGGGQCAERRSRGAQSRPSPALSHTSWNIFRMCLALSGVPVAVVNTGQCLPSGSASLPFSRLVSLPLSKRPDSHLRQLQRAAGPGRLVVSPGPIRARHRDRGRISVQVDTLPADRPGLLGAYEPSDGSCGG